MELVYCKKYFNPVKIFVSRLFKMSANQRSCSRHEQKSVIKFLVVKKYKPCEIYKQCVMCKEKQVLVKTIFINGLKMGLPLWVNQKDNQWPSSKEKVMVAAISKEGHADSDLEYERAHHYWFP